MLNFGWFYQPLADGYRLGDDLFGAPVAHVTAAADLADALRKALATNGPSVVEAVVDPEEYDEVL